MAAPQGSDSNILNSFEPEWLNQHGYINLDPALLASMDRDFYLDSTHRKTAKWHVPIAHQDPHGLVGAMSYHPIFRRAAWFNATDAQYTRLQPVLLLATRFLDEPAMLPYFGGVLNLAGMHALDYERAKSTTVLRAREHLKKFNKRVVISNPTLVHLPQHQINVWHQIRSLRNCVRFQIGDARLRQNDYAATQPDPTRAGFAVGLVKLSVSSADMEMQRRM